MLEIATREKLELEAQQQWVNPDPVTQAYMEIVEVRSYNDLPRVYKIDPYGKLPDTAQARVLPEDYIFPY